MSEEKVNSIIKAIYEYLLEIKCDFKINIYNKIIDKLEEIDNNNYNREFDISNIRDLLLNNNKESDILRYTESEISTNFNTFDDHEKYYEYENIEYNEDNNMMINDIAYTIFNYAFLNNYDFMTQQEIHLFLKKLRQFFS